MSESRTEGENGSRLIWSSDMLPHELRAMIAPLVVQGAEAMKATLERDTKKGP
jgi:hypothetical protein